MIQPDGGDLASCAPLRACVLAGKTRRGADHGHDPMCNAAPAAVRAVGACASLAGLR